jgi:hypothetical protein
MLSEKGFLVSRHLSATRNRCCRDAAAD